MAWEAAAEAEALARGCTQMVLSTLSLQVPEMYPHRGYIECGRIEDYPQGHAQLHLVERLGA
jgi:hypothetical protein